MNFWKSIHEIVIFIYIKFFRFYLVVSKKTSIESIEINNDKDWFASVYKKLIDIIIEKFM